MTDEKQYPPLDEMMPHDEPGLIDLAAVQGLTVWQRQRPYKSTLKQAFWYRTGPEVGPNGCRQWLGARTYSSKDPNYSHYGRLGFGTNGNLYAHRIACELKHGPCPPDKFQAGH